MPLYFWNNREGSSISYECAEVDHTTIKARIIAIYARRPKILEPETPHIQVKINTQLFTSSTIGNGLGIPVFAGTPLASSIFDLHLGIPCAWFYLNEKQNQDDITIKLDVNNSESLLKSVDFDNGLQMITTSDFIDLINNNCNVFRWDEALDMIKNFKREIKQQEPQQWIFGGLYKPFFIALIDN